jgi:glutaredoxin
LNVVLFTPPTDCSACRTTKLGFKRLGIAYEVVEADDALMDSLRREGFTEFPVVKVDCGGGAEWSWSGFRHDHIKKLAQLFG